MNGSSKSLVMHCDYRAKLWQKGGLDGLMGPRDWAVGEDASQSNQLGGGRAASSLRYDSKEKELSLEDGTM